MKFPKNRATVYVVLRHDSVCGVFAELEEADDYRGACEQEWLEKTGKKVYFRVQVSTFYG